ncbi:unknown [Sutterella sp. CAG:397]|nr:unknown [Sutterella sp. CAG:397]
MGMADYHSLFVIRLLFQQRCKKTNKVSVGVVSISLLVSSSDMAS